jgi:hypothetical protein
MANILGLASKNKFVHVQVQRGWTSDRDIIGFYNRLNRNYEVDKFGLYKLINSLQEQDRNNQLSLVLLDEANLSPIEHYWSGFMGACDDNSRFSTQGNPLKLPEGLRFIATVNYDRTTEPLSARFLDRSPVVYIENKNTDLFFDTQTKNDVEISEINFSFEYLLTLFGSSTNATLTEDEQQFLLGLIEKHSFMHIERRKIQNIINFVSTLRLVLDEGKSTNLKPLDAALLIYVLPLISGQGREYGLKIKIFEEYLLHNGLTLSAERLKEIINASKFDTYSYFS